MFLAIMRMNQLNPERRALLVRAAVALTAASVAVAFLPFRAAIRFGCVTGGPRKLDVRDCVWAIEVAALRLPWRTKCIEQGIATQRLLRRAGIDAVLHYGARHAPDSGKVEAHVWVSVADKTIIGGEEARDFAELAEYP